MASNKGIPHDTTPPPDGCKLHPSCFECPLPDCQIYAMPTRQGEYKRRYEWRRREARKMNNQGVKPIDIATKLRVTPQQVYKYLSND